MYTPAYSQRGMISVDHTSFRTGNRTFDEFQACCGVISVKLRDYDGPIPLRILAAVSHVGIWP